MDDGTQPATTNASTGILRGYRFTLGTNSLLVNALGLWDSDLDGLNFAHDVGLWDAEGVFLGSVTIRPGTDSVLVGEFRYESLSAPVFLDASGTYTIGATYSGEFTAPDRFRSGGCCPRVPPVNPPGPTFSSDIVSASPRLAVSDILQFPGPAGAAVVPYVGPNFQYSVVPEASVTSLLVLTLAFGATRRSRRGHFMNRAAFFGLVALLGLAAPQPLKAAIIFSTISPNDRFQAGGYLVDWTQSPSINPKTGEPEWDLHAQSIAVPFTVGDGVTYSLESVTLALGKVSGINNLTISVLADNEGEPGESILEVLAFDPEISAAPQALTFASVSKPTLTSGATYWVRVQANHLDIATSDHNSRTYWCHNEQSFTGAFAGRNFGTDWHGWQINSSASILPAMSVEATVVPEPNTSILLLLAMGVTVAWNRLTRYEKV